MTMDISNQNKLSEFYEELKRLDIKVVRPDINECFADFKTINDNFYSLRDYLLFRSLFLRFFLDSCGDNAQIRTSRAVFILTSNFAAEELVDDVTDDDEENTQVFLVWI